MFNWLDFLILGVILLNVILGLRQGLIQMVFGLIALVSATTLAVHNLDWVSELAKQYVDFPEFILSTGIYMIIWGSAYFGIYQIGRLISKVMHFTPIGVIDTVGGLILGVLKGVVIILVIVIPLITIPVIKDYAEATVQQSEIISQCQPLIEYGQELFEKYWPEDFSLKELPNPKDLINGISI